jgi:hypothetical protein
MKFLVTRELGRLATWLRILGYDTLYFDKNNLGSLIIQALRDDRIILTRNHRLPQARGVKIVLIQNENIKAQVKEVLEVLKIKPDPEMLFSRCILCNEKLVDIEKEKIKNKVPEYVFNTIDNFVNCPSCNRIYWQGTHWGNVKKTLAEVS